MPKGYTQLLDEHGAIISTLDQVQAELADARLLIGSLTLGMFGLSLYLLWTAYHD